MKKKIIGKDGKTYVLEEKKPFYKRISFWIVVLLLFGGIGAIIGGEEQKDLADENVQNRSLTDTVDKDESSSDITENNAGNSEDDSNSEDTLTSVETDKEADSSIPTEYNSALRNAENYSEMMFMSKAGIYDQLTSEYGGKFSSEAAQYAIDNIEADWNFNALKSAENYQEMMAMSPEAIRDQLTSEYGSKFTPEEADYAIQNLK